MSAADTGNALFEAATIEAKAFTKTPSQEDLLELYSLFKQSILGDNTAPSPGFLDFTGKAKWAAYNTKKGMSKADAQAAYIQKVAALK